MRLLLLCLAALLVAVLLGSVLSEDPGYVVVGFRGVVAEMSFLTFAILLVGAVLLVHWLLQLLGLFLSTPSRLARWSHERSARRSEAALSQGLLALAGGEWTEAERRLVKGADKAHVPALHYLAAAQAADNQQATDRRDEYLKRAEEAAPDNLAIALARADLCLRHGEIDQARATLERVRAADPKHAQVLRLLARLHAGEREWNELLALVPELRRRKALPDAEIAALEADAWAGLLQEASGGIDSLHALWKRVPKPQRSSPRVVAAYAARLLDNGAEAEAEALLRHTLDQHWDPALLRLYARLPATGALQPLAHAEAWLDAHPNDCALLSCLGELCYRNQLWGPARKYLEAAIACKPDPEAYHLLAETLVKTGDAEAAARASREGLRLATGRTTEERRLLPAVVKTA